MCLPNMPPLDGTKYHSFVTPGSCLTACFARCRALDSSGDPSWGQKWSKNNYTYFFERRPAWARVGMCRVRRGDLRKQMPPFIST